MGELPLPIPPTPLTGRTSELEELAVMLARPSVRLVSVVGAAGVGKTRFVLEFAHRIAESGGEAVFVALADVATPHAVGHAVVSALGATGVGNRPPLDVIIERLADRSVLLFVDNFEHLTDAAAMLAELLERQSTVKIVVTSRRPLAIRAEHCLRLSPLGVPAPDWTLDQIRSADAVALLVERIRAAEPRFVVDAMTVDTVVRICRRVDGLPLALELAAARVRGLPLGAIADALDDRIGVLESSTRDVADRHRTMSAAIGWSVEQLSKDAAAVYRRLAVCVGGATIDAAEALSDDLGFDRSRLFAALDELVDHSLIALDRLGRYRMLEVIRDFALDQLEAAGEAAAARRRHARFFLSLAEEASSSFTGPEQAAHLDRLELDLANFGAAVRSAVDSHDGDVALRLCLALRFLWYVRGSIAEGRRLFDAALTLSDASDGRRAAALSEAGALARHHGDFAAALELTEAAVAISANVNDPSLHAATLLQRGFVLHLVARYTESRSVLERSLELSHQVGDDLGVARASHHLGLVAAMADGDAALAWDLQCRALALFRKLQNERHVTTALIAMVELARARRDFVVAHDFVAEATAHLRRLQDVPLVVYLAHHAAALAADEGHPTRAVRLLGVAEGLEAASGAAPWPAIAAGASRWLPGARHVLGAQRVDLLRNDARSLGLSDALALAETRSDNGGPTGLTAREEEVAGLVGEGLSNRAIATTLVVSERTVEGHVTRILAKLGFRSRAQIASWVTRRTG